MAIQVSALQPSLPSTTAIQDPAVRRFAQAVTDALRASQTSEAAVQQLARAAGALSGGAGGGVPESIAQWLFSSDLYYQLADAIERVDEAAKQAIIDEAIARAQAISTETDARIAAINTEAAARASGLATEALNRANAINAEAAARSAAISNEATLRQDADTQLAGQITTLSASVDGNAAAIADEAATRASADKAEATARTTLAAQLRGNYTGTDLSAVTSGLFYQERIARMAADQGLSQQITLLSAGAGEQFDWRAIWYFDEGIEGWGGNGAPTAAGGWLRPQDHATEAYVTSPAGLAVAGDQYSQIRLRIRKVGAPTWAGFLWWRDDPGVAWDPVRRISITEPALDANGIGVTTIDPGWTGTIDGVRIDLSAAQDASNYFELDWVAIGRPAPGASSAQLLEEQMARASADAAEAMAREALSTKLVGTTDVDGLSLGSISSGLLFDERAARLSADAAAVSSINALTATVESDRANTTAQLAAVSEAIADGNAASASEISSIRAELERQAQTDEILRAGAQAIEAAIAEEASARASAIEAVTVQITSATSRLGAAEAAITAEATTRATADAAQAQEIDSLSATIGATNAAILDEQTVRAANDLAIVSAVNTALAQITGVSASISQSGQNLIANWSQAQATKWSQIESEVLTANGKTIRAALQQEATTRANADGSLGAQWTLKTDINGYISGFGFASTANNAAPTSEFIIRADKFAVVMPGYGQHVPFAIGPSGAEFTGLTSWGNVTGSGRPENGATVGADSSNLRAGPGVNMVFNGDYTDGLAGTTVGWRSGGNQHILSRNLSGYIVQGEGTAYIVQPGSNGTAVFYAYIWNGQEGQYFAVTPGQRYEVYAYLNTHRCIGTVIVLFHDAAGNQITGALGNEVGYAGNINTISDMRLSHCFVVAPWNAAKALVTVRGYGVNSYDPYVFFSRVYFGMAHAGQTEVSPWSPGRGISQITPSNVTTYIADAALGNAQIGGDIWSTNWNYAGGTGWLLDRSGNFYGNNIYARGDIEASSLKANTAMVNTLHINGNAVTVPVTYTSSATMALAYNTWTTVGSAYINPEGAVVFVHAFAQFSNNDSNSAPVFMRVVSPSGAVIAAAGPAVTSTMNWGAGTATRSGSVTLSGAFSETGTYTLQMHSTYSNYSAHHRALLLLAGKR